MKSFRGRKSKHDLLIANAAAMELYRTDPGPLPLEFEIPQSIRRKPRDPTRQLHPSERDIQRAILEYLHRSPKIAWAGRFNSGMFMEGDRYIRASSQRGLSDVLAMKKHTGQLIALEVKRPGAPVLSHQQAFLDMIAAGGGIAGVCRSVEDAIALIG